METTSSPTPPSLHSLKTLEHFRVSPPKGSVPDTSIPLTFFDIFWLLNSTVERLFFFKFPFSTSHFISDHLPIFKSSLSLTLQHFFPLAGHLRPSSSSPDDHYEINYSDGDSISLILTETQANFHELSGDQPRSFANLRPLIPSLTISNGATSPTSTPLMAIQVNIFPNQGICLAISINHVTGDGTSTMNFIHSWASTCFSSSSFTVLATPPLFVRSMVVDPNNLHELNLKLIRSFTGSPDEYSSNPQSPDDVFFSTFTLKGVYIEKLKSMIMARYEKDGKAVVPFHCTRFVVACAYIWTCLIRSRSWPEERKAHLGFSVDARPRLTPSIPAGYFGNCLGFCLAEVKVSDVVGDDNIDGVLKTIESLGKAIEYWVREVGVLKNVELLPRMFIELVDKRPLSIAGSPRFRVYEVDFGWGKPVKVEVTTIKETGAMSIAESGKEEGGLEFGLAFPKHEIDAFQACFTSGLKFLIP
ncbi:malonyl-coenzyme A:anthocyanin 3-O-glucoside-6''-O-malonyltransferase-like [Dioscorea cayenensis subsp. rotundata]|uniref:Malonyl-coenzyme A:anthocyanin 3-O-glucoside-6''-O-malonyltransferase-like n=1 Tax=Dioscorea cayennensis subsp. rotundata TaxID=55577 RepID=A0AB40C6A0_DIOCR|nr:malonyl-coenzyme A:anthocyanin 3-O-glucoside-6''-O-malonyltransferase-like [Dioscorea cayenensis subsp. rotundata]